MRWQKAAMISAAIVALGVFAQRSPVSAQTFDTYRCADGTQFILGFYPRDKRAYLQIDGHAITLKRRLTLKGRRYSGSGVSLNLTTRVVLLQHARRLVTACEL